jgi:ABC-type phosphate transport system auxiliary subunit
VTAAPSFAALAAAQRAAEARRKEIEYIEKVEIAGINHDIEAMRLEAKRTELDYGARSPEAEKANAKLARLTRELQARYATLQERPSS